MRSALRTIYVGRYWVDTSACLQFGCPPAAWTGEDLQSDAQAACLMSPVFMVEDMDQPVPHWATMGSLAFSTALAMPFAAILHTGLTVAERAELAACGHVFIDLMMMVARQLESERGVRKGSLSISNITARNLKDLAAAVLLMTSQVDELWCDPRYLSEIRIEMFFGRCRTSFTNSAFTYRQYLQSSMRVSQKNMQAFKNSQPSPNAGLQTKLDSSGFQQAVQKGSAAALSFMCLLSGISKAGVLNGTKGSELGSVACLNAYRCNILDAPPVCAGAATGRLDGLGGQARFARLPRSCWRRRRR